MVLFGCDFLCWYVGCRLVGGFGVCWFWVCGCGIVPGALVLVILLVVLVI